MCRRPYSDSFRRLLKKNDSSSGSDSKGDAKKEYYNAQPVDTGWEWGNVEIVDGGFIPDVIYNPTEEGLIYARTDMGGAYKYNKDTQRWECITDCFGGDDWNYNGTESLATDPVEPNRVYLAAGTYSTNNGAIFASDDYGKNWTICEMPFGMGGNEVGRGCGERLQVDPNDNSILYFGSRADGLWKSTDYGATWNEVTSFPTKGGYTEEGYSIGLTFVAFDKSSSEKGQATKTIIVGSAGTQGIISIVLMTQAKPGQLSLIQSLRLQATRPRSSSLVRARYILTDICIQHGLIR